MNKKVALCGVLLMSSVLYGGNLWANRLPQHVTQKNTVIKGHVTDSFGEPIIGATVQEIGTTKGTVTNVDGNFELDVEANAPLRISYRLQDC